MIRQKNDADILFRRVKDVALRYGPSASFMRWRKDRYPGLDAHHVFGSAFSRKSTDFLTVSLDRQTHTETHADRDKIIELLPAAVNDLIQYCIWLEQQVKGERP